MTLTSIPVCPPVVFSHWGNLVKTLPKSACWVGDYNAVPPTESQEPAKSWLGLHPPSHFSPLFPCALSQGLTLSESLVLFISFHLSLSLLSPSTSWFLFFLHRLYFWHKTSRFFFRTHQPSLYKQGKEKNTERKTERERQRTDVEGREQQRPMGRLIRKLHWQRSQGWLG